MGVGVGLVEGVMEQDLDSSEQARETLALLRLLAIGERDIADGRTAPVREVAARMRAKRAS